MGFFLITHSFWGTINFRAFVPGSPRARRAAPEAVRLHLGGAEFGSIEALGVEHAQPLPGLPPGWFRDAGLEGLKGSQRWPLSDDQLLINHGISGYPYITFLKDNGHISCSDTLCSNRPIYQLLSCTKNILHDDVAIIASNMHTESGSSYRINYCVHQLSYTIKHIIYIIL